MDNSIREALEKSKENLQNSYIAIVEDRFIRIQQSLGPQFKEVYNNWTWAKIFRETISPNCVRDEATKIVSISPEKLKANAELYAGATVEAWYNKIQAKLGMLDEAKVCWIDGYSFRITGKRNGDSVIIEQGMIINTSPKGTVFNQFPSRIYVNGKFTPEAKFKLGDKQS